MEDLERMKKFKKIIAIALMATIFSTTATAATASAHHCRTRSTKKYYHDDCPYKNCNRTYKHSHASRGHCYR